MVSILCQSRLFLLQETRGWPMIPASSIHPLSIEAISPTNACDLKVGDILLYPSSVNRGYFSYGIYTDPNNLRKFVSILCQSRLFLLPLAPVAQSPGGQSVSILCQSRLFLLRFLRKANCQSPKRYPSSVNRGYFSYPQGLG